MTPTEKMAQRLTAPIVNVQGISLGTFSTVDKADAAALIRRLAAALIEYHAAYKAGGWAKDGIEERHAEALRDVGEQA